MLLPFGPNMIANEDWVYEHINELIKHNLKIRHGKIALTLGINLVTGTLVYVFAKSHLKVAYNL